MKNYAEIFERYYFLKNQIKTNLDNYLDLIKKLKVTKQYQNILSLYNSFNSSKFKITVVGKIGAGKSSLINLLLNQDMLKTASGAVNDPDNLSPVTESVQKLNFSGDSYTENTIKFETNAYNETEVIIPGNTYRDDIEIYDTPGLTQSTILFSPNYEYISASDIVIYVFNPAIKFDDAEIKYIQKNISKKNKKSIYFAISLEDICPDKQTLDNLKLAYEPKLKEILKTDSINLFAVSSNYCLNLKNSIYNYLIEQKGSKKLLRTLKTLYTSLLETLKYLAENTGSSIDNDSLKKLEAIKQEAEILSRGIASEADKKEIQEELDSFHKIGINIKDCARFILNSAEKYELPEETKSDIEKDAQVILEKENSDALYLGIAGEFSSGKDTLINTFMRSNFLKSDTLPVNTPAATVFKYGENPDIELKLKSGTRLKYSEDKEFFNKINASIQNYELKEEEKLKELLTLITADEKVVENIEQVTLFINAEGLKNGLAIADLPVNIQNSVHNLCDAIIIVIPADNPLTLTSANLIKENLTDIADRCLFAVTKLEFTGNSQDRNIILENIAERLTSELNIENPKVFPVPSLILNKNKTEKTDVSGFIDSPELKNADNFISEFTETEMRIQNFLRENKLKLQMGKLSVLIPRTLHELEEYLEKQEGTFKKSHEALMGSKIGNLDSFVKEYRVKYSSKIFSDCEKYKTALQSCAKDCKAETTEKLTLMLNNAENTSQINSVIKNNMGSLLNENGDKIIHLYNNLLTQLFDNTGNYKAEFEQQFTALYKDLGAPDTSDKVPELKRTQDFKNNNFLGPDFDEYLKGQKNLLSSGAVGRAAIDTAISPMIGTAMKAFFNGFTPAFFRPSAENLRKKYISQLEPKISTFYSNLLDVLLNNLQSTNINTANYLFISMDQYISMHRSFINQMIKQDEQLEKQLTQFNKSIKYDINKLIGYQQSIEVKFSALY